MGHYVDKRAYRGAVERARAAEVARDRARGQLEDLRATVRTQLRHLNGRTPDEQDAIRSLRRAITQEPPT